MGTTDTWGSSAPQGRASPALQGARHLQSTHPAWCCPCLIPPFPPCLAPWGFGEHSRAAWPAMSLVHPLFEPHLVSQKAEHSRSGCVCPQQPGNGAELSIAPPAGAAFPALLVLLGTFHWGVPTLISCLFAVFPSENPRLVWGGGTWELILPSPPLWMFQYSSSSS